MRFSVDAFRTALADVPPIGDAMAQGAALAERLSVLLDAARAESAIVEVHSWAFSVEFVLRNDDYWAIECLSADAFRMYPGFHRNGAVVWANVWVRDSDLSLDELVEQMNKVAFPASRDV
jgi:hypothetical protein